jgi:uncharacterized protein YdiU (UPF0061 family)
MRKKLGLANEEKADGSLAKNLLDIMKKYNADYTNTFRALTMKRIEDTGLQEKEEFKQWVKQWKDRLNRQQKSEKDVLEIMRNHNPAVIPRNHRVEEALEAAVENNDHRAMNQLLAVLADPYAYTKEQEEYAKPPEPSNQPYQTFCGT